MSGLRIAAIRLLCPDPAATASFYAAAFGCSHESFGPDIVLAFGRERIELAATVAEPGRPAASNETAFQHCAIIVSDMAAAIAHLATVPGWSAISRAGPESLPAASGSVTAFKFRDPDGHPLELLWFPPDVVPAVWRDREGLFLGIDHTAITVVDTARSVAFYAGLGFTVSGRGVNLGAEQARMDDLDEPVVDITGLTLPGGGLPRFELLSYREPGTLPRLLREDDVLATRIVLGPASGSQIMSAAADEHSDPDGHRIRVYREA